jgi:hypothetical protein
MMDAATLLEAAAFSFPGELFATLSPWFVALLFQWRELRKITRKAISGNLDLPVRQGEAGR